MKASFSKWLACGVVAVLGSMTLAPSADAAWANGWWVYPYTNFANDTIARRPFSENDRGLALSDWKVSGLRPGRKGFGIGATQVKGQKTRAFRWIAIWHCEIVGARRSGPGDHVDFIQIVGGGNNQDIPTTVLLQDIDIHDGDAIPVIIQDGWFDKITLRDVRYRNTTVGIQIAMINSGKTDTIIVDHCPNASIAVMGRPGSVKEVYVKNSPGVKLNDVVNKNGKTGCRIVRLN